MVAAPLKCDLCAMEIHAEPVIRDFDGVQKHFCCEGCARVYSEAKQKGILDQVLKSPPMHKKEHVSQKEVVHFSINGMWCSGCALAAENVLRSQPGILSTDISFAAEKGRLEYDPQLGKLEDAFKSLKGLGYHAYVSGGLQDRNAQRQEENTLLHLLVAIGFGMQIMLLYLVQLYPRYALGEFNAPDLRNLQYLLWGLATPVLFYGGSSYLRGTWRAVRAKTATMDTLVTLGTLSAYVYSAFITVRGNGEVYFDSIVMITVFIMLGRYLEKLGGSQARKDIQSLLRLQPEIAHRKKEGAWEDVSPSQLMLDQTILVKRGERIPTDGIILAGSASINEALLTGESLPVSKQENDSVFAGTLVEDSSLQIVVTKMVGDSRLAKIAALVEETLSQKAPIQRLADKSAAIFAFVIIFIAIVTAITRILIGQPFSQALLIAVSVLVVACPCALGLATPVALVVTLGRATRAGLIIRNQDALETSPRIDEVIFDKTGTLTLAKLALTSSSIDPKSNMSAKELYHLAASLEQFSEHPIAQAITAGQLNLSEPQHFQVIKGMGTRGEVEGRQLKIGSINFFGKAPSAHLNAEAEERAALGETVIWFGWDEKPIAFFTLSDQLNPTASSAIGNLRQKGILVSLLSGDTPTTSAAIAQRLGLEKFIGFCTPDKKAEIIKNKQHWGEKVAMVGDGVNDAPALAQADLSFTAFGGTDIAGETSDVILTKPDLTLVPWFIQLASKSRRIIIENLAWAFAYNLVSVPLAAMGIISPIIAAAAMATSSVLVVFNSLRLQRIKVA